MIYTLVSMPLVGTSVFCWIVWVCESLSDARIISRREEEMWLKRSDRLEAALPKPALYSHHFPLGVLTLLLPLVTVIGEWAISQPLCWVLCLDPFTFVWVPSDLVEVNVTTSSLRMCKLMNVPTVTFYDSTARSWQRRDWNSSFSDSKYLAHKWLGYSELSGITGTFAKLSEGPSPESF